MNVLEMVSAINPIALKSVDYKCVGMGLSLLCEFT